MWQRSSFRLRSIRLRSIRLRSIRLCSIRLCSIGILPVSFADRDVCATICWAETLGETMTKADNVYRTNVIAQKKMQSWLTLRVVCRAVQFSRECMLDDGMAADGMIADLAGFRAKYLPLSS